MGGAKTGAGQPRRSPFSLRSALRAWSRSTRNCCQHRTGCSRPSLRYWEAWGHGPGGGDSARQPRDPREPCPECRVGGSPALSSWEFPLASAAWVLCGVPAEPPRLVFSPQALLAVKSVPLEEDPETEVPTHPGDGAPQPGNSKVSGCPDALPEAGRGGGSWLGRGT